MSTVISLDSKLTRYKLQYLVSFRTMKSMLLISSVVFNVLHETELQKVFFYLHISQYDLQY